MPRGLFARYTQYLQRRMEIARQGDRLTREQRLLLGVMAAAEEPLPLRLLARIADMDEDDAADELSVFGSLVRAESGERVSLFSKRFRDYLLESPVQAFRVRRERGDRAIAEYVLGRCRTAAALAAEPWLASHGLLHALRRAALEPETENETAEYLIALQKTGDDIVTNALAAALGSGEEAVLGVYCRLENRVDPYGNAYRRLYAMRDMDTLALLAAAYEAAGNEAYAYLLYGDLAQERHTPEGDEEAEAWFKKVLALDEQSYAEHPSYDSRRSLGVTYDRFGDLARNRHTPEGDAEADAWYKKALALLGQNCAEYPGNQSRDDLEFTRRQLYRLNRQKNLKAWLKRPEDVDQY